MSTPAPPSTHEPLDYRPISGLALAGFGLGAAYASVIAVGGMLALFRGRPFLLAGWTLLLPIGAALVSYLGQAHIRNAEGTRAGEKLARWGLWLSVGFGLAYFVYSLGTSLAIRRQADTAASEFLDALKQSARSPKHAAIALLSIHAEVRDQVSPENEAEVRKLLGRPRPGAPSAMHQFRNEALTRFFACGAPAEMNVETLGVVDWRFEGGGFVVERLYRLTNEEAVVEALITMRSVEGKAGEARRWRVVKEQSGIHKDKIQPKPLSQPLMRVRILALNFCHQWAAKLMQGEAWKLPDSDHADAMVSDAEQSLAAYKRLQDLFASDKAGRFSMEPNREPAWLPWRREEGRLHVTVPCSVLVPAAGKEQALEFHGVIEIRSKDTVAAIDAELAPEWEIYRVEFREFSPKVDKGGAGPMGPG